MIYHRTRKFHANEVRAYAQLRPLQGRCVPEFIDSVVLCFTAAPGDLPAEFFQAPGMLLELIPGFPLTEVALQLPDQPRLWEKIVQSAISVVKEVNNAGVVHSDCQPRNVLVAETDEGGLRPYLIDFAQSAFRDGYQDTDDVDDEKGYTHLVHLVDNHGAIAVLMMQRIARTTPHQIHIQEI